MAAELFDPASDWARALRQVRSACQMQDWALAQSWLARMQQADPRHPLTWLARARYAQARQQPEQACEALEQAIMREPDLFDAWLSLGQLRAQMRQYSAALTALQQALRLRPLSLPALQLLIALLQLTGDLPALDGILRLLLNQNLSTQTAWRALPHADQQALLAQLPAWDGLRLVNDFAWGKLDFAALQMRLRQWRTRHLAGVGPLSAHGHLLADSERRLRVGYLSSEWEVPYLRHVYFGAWQMADTDAFEQIAYRDDGAAALPPELAGCFSAVQASAHLSEAELYARIQADRIDILVDLSGFFNARRLRLFARKPAPVQINAASNPPFTLGLDCYDALFGDPWLLPPDWAAACIEPVRYLQTFLRWRPPGPTPPAAVARPAVQPRLGAAASNNKLCDATLALWGRVLAALPQARLTLKNQTFRDEGVCERLRRRFGLLGGDAGRLDFEDNQQRQDLISFFADCDLVLDAFPYGGALSVCDAFWAGVPVLGLKGGFHIAEAVHGCLGTPELLAEDADDYCRKAQELMTDTVRRQFLRTELPRRLLASPAVDARGQMRQMQALYRELWRQWVQGRGLA